MAQDPFMDIGLDRIAAGAAMSVNEDVVRSPVIHNDQNRVHKSSPTTTGNGISGLNPRSCIVCRKRKVKCDKLPRCTNCVKANIDCVYPAPGRAPRRPRKAPDSELMDRLKKLEGVVNMLGTQVPEDDKSPTRDGPEPEKTAEQLSQDERIAKACKELKELKRQKWEQDKEKKPPPQTGLEKRFGRLVVDEGRSRYINPSFWASLSDEVENIKEMLNDSDDDEDQNYPSPETTHSSSSHQGFVFGYSSQNVDMNDLHPPGEHVPIYWKIFRENVDPLVKIIHAPSMEPTILEAADHLDKIHRGLETLMFAIYYGAVTSMWEEECKTQFGEEKAVLLARYRFGIEQALARADFLQTDEMIVLQAFVLFLICLRRNDDARVIWTLTGLVVRMAQTLGLHRDGTHYGLPPFQIEMRRRLWWQICILDSRASEDHGADPTIIDQLFDTQMPINANDEDLDPNMPSIPESKTGCTQMTFGLIRFEISNVLRRLQYVPPGPRRCNKFFSELSVEKKEQWVRELHERLENQYLRDTDMNVPLYWVVATISRLIMSKLWLIIYHPFQRLDGGSSLPQEVRDKLFSTSLENCEYSILLETEEKTKRWGWLFRTYTQWHAIAFMLSELTVRTTGPEVERAWKMIDYMVGRRWNDDHAADAHANKLKSHLWKPLKKLMERARKAHQDAVEKQQKEQTTATTADNTLDLERTSSIMNMDLSVDRLFPDLQQDDGSLNFNGNPVTMNGFGTNTNTNGFGTATNANGFITPPSNELSPNQNFNNLGNLDTNFANTSGGGISSMAAPADPNSFSTMANEWYMTPASNNTGNANNGFDASLNGAFDTTTGTTDSPLMPDGSVNWTSWDNLVAQYGMELDEEHQAKNGGGPYPYGNTFSSITQWY